MQSDIDKLIELLQEEKLFIEQCIKDNIDEFEYLHAHIHTKTLTKLNTQLRIFKQLKDPFYNKKMELEMQLEMYKQFRKDSPDIDLYYQKVIAEVNDELKKLNESNAKPQYDDQKVDDAIFNIRAGRHNGFIIYLNVKDNLGFTFELLQTDILSISIDVKSALNVEYLFEDDEDENPLNKFSGLGFGLNQTGSKLVYKYNMEYFKDAISIKRLLSRVIYDIFTYAELDKQASLVYF
ncbi:hypothetical protein [Mucilaginibacter aquariorum]|uniref:Uncharacterized protein n=1 Tax=Mucilaginibacter aquariorum TaxID=2967225 RepID=A0ABT1T591_9SPHI|nr:hypothetical protein [Mucilaginibacter aquariorum]MCQ6959742.1 hypothetical protein [Mucilaginibacter aquariorum]